MKINLEEYRSRMLGCWMGKNIGGTLGAPMEWARQLNDVSFYTQELGGEPLPNDDLDIQLLWLVALEERGLDLNAQTLAEYWLSFMTPHWAEYGISKAHMRGGLMPPVCSIEDNPYKHSCGAYIRSEIWACIAPGLPRVAAEYAYQDAILDHGDGEGVYAEVFSATLESAAFVERDSAKLIEIALSYIPRECAVARVVRAVQELYAQGKSWLEARDAVLRDFRGQYASWAGCSQRDRELGLADGALGYDVPSNIGILVIGWLWGEGDFEKTLCITVNCGEDTDCTAATVGALWGILNGIERIPQKWIEPIGRSIKTLCIDLGDVREIPGSIDELAQRVERIAGQLTLRHAPGLLGTEPSSATPEERTGLMASGEIIERLYCSLCGPVYRGELFEVRVDYSYGVRIHDGSPLRIRLVVAPRHRTPMVVGLKWYADPEWHIGPTRSGRFYVGGANAAVVERSFMISVDAVPQRINRFVVELTVEGRPTVMLVPVVLVDGNM